MKPLELHGVKAGKVVHLVDAEGQSLCGLTVKGRRQRVDGLEDPALCPGCREAARGLSVSILS